MGDGAGDRSMFISRMQVAEEVGNEAGTFPWGPVRPPALARYYPHNPVQARLMCERQLAKAEPTGRPEATGQGPRTGCSQSPHERQGITAHRGTAPASCGMCFYVGRKKSAQNSEGGGSRNVLACPRVSGTSSQRAPSRVGIKWRPQVGCFAVQDPPMWSGNWWALF